jgi:hypothetical protein
VPLALNGSLSPYQVMVQMPGTAHRVRGEAFLRECDRCEDLQSTSLTFASHVLQQVVQSAVCHAFHPLTQRVCRWLLVSRDCAHANTFEHTQEFMAHMLGVSRPKVSHSRTPASRAYACAYFGRTPAEGALVGTLRADVTPRPGVTRPSRVS